jgi:hypothetical protein
VSGSRHQEVFRYLFTLEDEGTFFFETSGTAHPVVQRHIHEDQNPQIMLTFFSRYEHYFKEFGSFREDHYRNMLLKSSVHWDANLPCCGNLQFGEKNCKGNCHVEMLSDPMFSQFCSYKMPSLADDICEVKPVMKAAEYDHTIDINDETFNKKNSGGQSTVRSLSSVMSTLEANKNGVSVPPISNR